MPDSTPHRQPTLLSQSIALFGEERPEQSHHELRWGKFSAKLEAALLRDIRLQGIELIRGVEFVARDENWGTLDPGIERVGHLEHAVDLAGVFAFRRGALPWTTRIDLTDDGLTITGRAEAAAPALTNRTGFVLLHPLECAGAELEIEHTDGRVVPSRFPELIRPDQPAMGIRSLRYAPADGLWLELRFEGDTFEMEDQRNWLDASFKTYCRPHGLPKPYSIEPGSPIEQRISVRIEQRPVQVRIPKNRLPEGRVPAIGLGVPTSSALPTQADAGLLASLQPAFLLIEHDLAQPGEHVGEWLGKWAKLAREIGAEFALDVWQGRGTKPGVEEVARAQPAWITLDEPPFGAARPLLSAIREALPDTQLGNGTRAFFTELNRDRPGPDGSFVRWTMNPTVHATDDATVMQNNATSPWSVRTAESFANGRNLVIGPQTLRMRFNPEQTTEPAPPPKGKAPADADPRQRGLFGAAWTIAHAAGLLHQHVVRVAFFEPLGPKGVVYRRAAFEQPWFDALADTPRVYPVYLSLSALTEARGRRARSLGTSGPVQGMELLDGDGPAWILANTSAQPAPVPPGASRWSVLDAKSMAAACCEPIGFWQRAARPTSECEPLGAYAVVMGWRE